MSTRHVTNEEVKRQVLQDMINVTTDGAYEVTIKKLPKTRTAKQNRALHLAFTQMADELDSAGYTVQTVLSNAVDREWTADGVKELLFRPVMRAMTEKESTTELETKQVSEVFDVLGRHLGEKFGITAVMPSLENM